MSAIPSTQLADAANAGKPAATAVLLVDPKGLIIAANASAHTLWQVPESELIGEAFSSLFYFEVVSEGADGLEAQWEVVLATTLDRGATFGIQPREGAPFNQLVRLEPALGAAAGYIAASKIPRSPRPTPPLATTGLACCLSTTSPVSST